VTSRGGRSGAGSPDPVTAAIGGGGPVDVWGAVAHNATVAIDGRPPAHGRAARPHGRTVSDTAAFGASPHPFATTMVGRSPAAGSPFHHGIMGGGGHSSSLLDVAAAAAAAEAQSPRAAGAGTAPPFARLGSDLPPPSAAGTNVASVLPELGMDADERMFLKREQWRFHRSGRIAPVLPPNDLLWMIWERVDRLTQQALLQRAMGRLDVPADLEDVSPRVIDAEAKLLAKELEARGIEPGAAMRAATLAAMAGTAEVSDEGMPEPPTPTSGASGAGRGKRPSAAAGTAGMMRAAMAARRLRAGLAASRQRHKRQSIAAADDDDGSDDDGFDAGAFLASRRKGHKAPVHHHPDTVEDVAVPVAGPRMALAPPPV